MNRWKEKLVKGKGVNDVPYQVVIDGKICDCYARWSRLLGNSSGYYTDNKIEMCESWLMFSNFKSWFVDERISAEKLYSTEKLCLITTEFEHGPNTTFMVPRFLDGTLRKLRKMHNNKYAGITEVDSKGHGVAYVVQLKEFRVGHKKGPYKGTFADFDKAIQERNKHVRKCILDAIEYIESTSCNQVLLDYLGSFLQKYL